MNPLRKIKSFALIITASLALIAVAMVTAPSASAAGSRTTGAPSNLDYPNVGGVFHKTATPPRLAGSGCISGRTLSPNTSIYAPPAHAGESSEYVLSMQGDGNLVEYELGADRQWHPIWQTQTGVPGSFLAVQGGDGNLVVYSPSGKALWAAFSFLPGQPGVYSPNDRLCLQADGNLVLYSTSGAALWATMTFFPVAGHRTYINQEQTGFPTGQCTRYANEMFHNWNIRGDYVDFGGNAWYWADTARSKGWTVGTTPRAGSVVVYQPGSQSAGGVGHVAWVRDVYPSLGKVLISEMNFKAWNQVDYRLVAASDATSNATTHEPNIQYIYENPSMLAG